MKSLFKRAWLEPVRRHPIVAAVLFGSGLVLGGVPATCGQPPGQSSGAKMGYRGASNGELAKKAMDMVGALRAMVREMNAADEQKRAECDQQELRERIGEARAALRQKCHDDSMRAIQAFLTRYNEKYKADALILREELLHRLPELRKKAGPAILFSYPTNPLGLEEVASSLEIMSKLLPGGSPAPAKP